MMRVDPGYYHHGFWLFELIPILMFVVVVGVAVWAVIRLSSRPAGPVPFGSRATPPMPRDPALEELRVRYARGEVDREEFLQRSRDLGGTDDGMTAPPGGSSPAPAG
jgi:putative membrane protein